MEQLQNSKLSEAPVHGDIVAVSFVETQDVADGVECDVYKIDGDETMDIAVVRVQPGHTTPLQLVKSGVRTTEIFSGGSGTLKVTTPDGVSVEHAFTTESEPRAIDVNVGDTMQWTAGVNETLEFHEVCIPPYQDGRFENLD